MSRPSTVLRSLSEGTAGPKGPRWPPARPVWPEALWNDSQPLNKWTPPPRLRHHFPSGTLRGSAPGCTKSRPTLWTPSVRNIWEWICDAQLPPLRALGLIGTCLQPFGAFYPFVSKIRSVALPNINRSRQCWSQMFQQSIVSSFSWTGLDDSPHVCVGGGGCLK